MTWKGKYPGMFFIPLAMAFGAVLLFAYGPASGKKARSRKTASSSSTTGSSSKLATCSSNRPGMVCIPGGRFTMGSHQGDRDEEPPHKVWVDEFLIDKYEVTFKDYQRCVKAGRCLKPQYSILKSADKKKKKKKKGLSSKKVKVKVNMDLPVVGVDWNNAKKYCESLGKRLPTEAEWEKAARGVDGRRFPWGNTPPNCKKANIASCKKGLRLPGRFPKGASPYGLLDMSGNVWEWVYDWYDAGFYKKSNSGQNPYGPVQSTDPITGKPHYRYKILRGGSYSGSPSPLWITYRFRLLPNSRSNDIGFRCAMSKGGKSPIPAALPAAQPAVQPGTTKPTTLPSPTTTSKPRPRP